jgi:hypothetical protein
MTVDTITQLTHNELQLNLEFMKYVSLVGSLEELIEELITLWEKSTVPPTFLCEFPPFHHSFCAHFS